MNKIKRVNIDVIKMQFLKKFIIFSSFFFIAYILVGNSKIGNSEAYAQEFAVVANPSAPDISPEDLKKIYLGLKKTLPDGTKASPLLIKGTPEEFYVKVTGLTKVKFAQHWMTKIIEGTGEPPRYLQTEEELIAAIKENKGAIGVLPLYKAKSEGLKILLVIK